MTKKGSMFSQCLYCACMCGAALFTAKFQVMHDTFAAAAAAGFHP